LLHIADVQEYVASNPADKDAAAVAKLTGVRTVIIVPMLRDGDVVGAIVIYRKEVRSFDDREIALIDDFAAQAVIAIENARLLNELDQRATDLSESLEQQTATSDVLQEKADVRLHEWPTSASGRKADIASAPIDVCFGGDSVAKLFLHYCSQILRAVQAYFE
jgi:GAF domain-containing protein